MHEAIMKRNYKKAVRTVAILAVLLARFSAIAVPLSLSRQIQDLNNLKETVQEQTVQQDEHADEFHGLSHEELWKSQITPLSAMNYAILGGTAVLWLVLGAYYWLLVIFLLRWIPAVHAYGMLLASFVMASCYHGLCAHFVRARGNTALFAAQGLLNTALFLAWNVLFLAIFHWGVRGYVLSTTVANLVTTGFLVWKERLWRFVGRQAASSLQRQMLQYCIPLIPAAVFCRGCLQGTSIL